MKFVIIGKTKKSKGDITREIMEMGGHITSKVGADTAACISTKGRLITQDSKPHPKFYLVRSN